MSVRARKSAVEIFDAASRLARDEQEAYLRRVCGEDHELLGEVRSLLSHLSRAGDFLDRSPLGRSLLELRTPTPGPGLGSILSTIAGALPAGSRVGRYTIERTIGEGGMGVVYQAQQDHPRRSVALKVVRPSIATPAMVRRFTREAELLGRLQHPGIAQIFEAGTAGVGGDAVQPFLAMELVHGEPITEYARRRNLDIRERLTLVARLCEAVAHAHQRGLIHRDLKPANILVDTQGQPKILDFGVARAIDSANPRATLATEVGTLVGTLAYMSPEQISGDPAAVDTRADIYALGVILYELVCARPPHDTSDLTLFDAARRIREQEPTRPGTVLRELRGDIETITLKAMAKERDRRYTSADGLREDIRRFLAGEPILARQDSALYVLKKQLRRYRWTLGTAAIITGLLAGFGVWSSVKARAFRTLAASEAAAKGDAEARGRQVREQLRQSNIERGRMLVLRSDLDRAEGMLWEEFAESPGSPDALWALRELYFRYPASEPLTGADAELMSARFSPDGKLLATAGDAGVIHIWDTVTGALLQDLVGHEKRALTARFSPDGTLLASAGSDSAIRLWDVRTWTPAGELAAGPVSEVAFDCAGSRLFAAGRDGVVRQWDVASRALLRETEVGKEVCWDIRLLRDESLVAVCDQGGRVHVLDAQTLTLLRQFQAHSGWAQGIDISPDGSTLASLGRDGMVALWNAGDWSLINRVNPSGRAMRRAAFSPGGSRLLVAGLASTLMLDSQTLEPVTPWFPEIQGGWGAEYSPDGKLVVTTSRNPGAARLWSIGPYAGHKSFPTHRASTMALAVSPDGRLIASGGSDGAYSVRDARTGEEIHRWLTTSQPRAMAFSPDCLWLATAHLSGRLRVTRMGDPQHSFVSFRGHSTAADCVDFLPDGRLVTGGADGFVRVWNAPARQELLVASMGSGVVSVAPSPNGKLIAVNAAERIGILLAADDLRVVAPGVERPAAPLRLVGFTPDGNRLIMPSSTGTIEIWDPYSESSPEQLAGHTRAVVRAQLSADGALLATAGQDGLLSIWDLASRRSLASFDLEDKIVQNMVWVPGTLRFVTSSNSGVVHFWDLSPLDRRVARNGLAYAQKLEARGGSSASLQAWLAGPGVSRTDRPATK